MALAKNRRTTIIVCAIIAIVIGGGAWAVDQRTHSYRFRMTVEVETPEGLRSGSSVMEITTTKPIGPILPDANKAYIDLTGEAVAVDLPSGTLFALIGNTAGGRDLEFTVTNALEPSFVGGGTNFVNAVLSLEQKTSLERKAVLKPNQLPLMVRFRDIADPKTVEKVDPENLEASFGKGIDLKAITVEVTDDPLTLGIHKRFVWWRAYINKHFDNTSTISENMLDKSLAAHLSSGSFSTEYNK